jgi:hypothetical protein
MQALYGSNFQNIKRKRTKYVTIPITETHTGRVVSSYQILPEEIKELVKPLTSIQTFKNNNGELKTIEGIFDPETGENIIEDPMISIK